MKNLIDGIVKYIILPFVTPTTPGSIGRLLLTFTFGVAMFRFWFFKQDPPTTMMEVLFMMLVYIFGTKIMDWKRGTSSDIPLPKQDDAQEEVKP